ncbi:hypothetical protein L596_017228 [Steinernema carpocapsae]|uniref:BTB domain-containing protein n=1 Tax=Steinernema carpocapsae TaxID=34508 RepID=A0A4U5N117_STECR|nr:hypothetical protein L596_017228 [Steinernema carpocapsae]
MKIFVSVDQETKTIQWSQVQVIISATADQNEFFEFDNCRTFCHNMRWVFTSVQTKTPTEGEVTVLVTLHVQRSKKFYLYHFVEGISDVKIVFEDNHIYASKLVLSAQSSYFNKFFESQEFLKTGICNLPDVEMTSFLFLLHGAYGLPIDLECNVQKKNF